MSSKPVSYSILLLFFLSFAVGASARRHNESRESDDESSEGRHKWPFKKPPNPPVYVKTSAGVVRGYVTRLSGRDKPVNVFKGVPFAEPPLGELRFRKLQKKTPWKGTWNATVYSPACPSNTSRTTSPQNHTDEDCIYANIFAGRKCTQRNLCPVLFYVHGGAFGYDSAVMFNDTEIIRKYAADDIVFIIPAYRLGVFGFLDLGNDDTVPRNLGMHDIIFAMKWAQKELEAFGGDPKRVTLFGNSAGASAIEFLCVSPAVPKKLFQQAFISSGEPYLAENVNEVPTREILNEFGCLYDQFNQNRTLADKEKVDCLRRVPALDLLETQRWFEDERGLLFGGPETDTELLPAKTYAELLPKWKPRPTVFSVTLHEFENRGENMTVECSKKLRMFGYQSDAAFRACVEKYGNLTEEDEYLPLSADAYHAEAFILAYINSLKGANSYLLSFDLENHTNHANDLTFFFGLHPVQGRNMTPEERLMDAYYPEMVKRFLRTGRPAKDWKPLNRNGSDYYVLDFRIENDTIVEKPHPVSDFYDPEALKFWLKDLADIEREAEEEQEAENSTALPWRPTVGNWPFPKGKEHDYDWLTPGPHHRPPVGNFPFPTGREHDYDWITPRPNRRPPVGNWPFPPGREHDYDWLSGSHPAYWRPYLNRMNLMAQPPENASAAEAAAKASEDGALPIREVWSAFWLVMSLAILLTAIILLMVAIRLVYRFKNVRGYSYNNDDGFFSERSKIITVGNNGTRYT